MGVCAVDRDDDRAACQALLSRRRLSDSDGGRRSSRGRLDATIGCDPGAAGSGSSRRRALLRAVHAPGALRSAHGRLLSLRFAGASRQENRMATERFRTPRCPRTWADMHGWPELTATVAAIYAGLPPAQRAQSGDRDEQLRRSRGNRFLRRALRLAAGDLRT